MITLWENAYVTTTAIDSPKHYLSILWIEILSDLVVYPNVEGKFDLDCKINGRPNVNLPLYFSSFLVTS